MGWLDQKEEFQYLCQLISVSKHDRKDKYICFLKSKQSLWYSGQAELTMSLFINKHVINYTAHKNMSVIMMSGQQTSPSVHSSLGIQGGIISITHCSAGCIINTIYSEHTSYQEGRVHMEACSNSFKYIITIEIKFQEENSSVQLWWQEQMYDLIIDIINKSKNFVLQDFNDELINPLWNGFLLLKLITVNHLI